MPIFAAESTTENCHANESSAEKDAGLIKLILTLLCHCCSTEVSNDNIITLFFGIWKQDL
jgi:hypothetical protein